MEISVESNIKIKIGKIEFDITRDEALDLAGKLNIDLGICIYPPYTTYTFPNTKDLTYQEPGVTITHTSGN